LDFLMRHRFPCIFVGTVMVVYAYTVYTVPNGVINGGTSSLAMSLSTLIPLSVSAWVTILTAIIALLCLLILGWRSFQNSVFSCSCYLILFHLLERYHSYPVLPVYVYLPLAGLIAGIGLYLCSIHKASTIGTDTLGLILHKYVPALSVGNCMAIFNILIMVVGLATHGAYALIKGILFTLIRTFVMNMTGKLIEKKAPSKKAA